MIVSPKKLFTSPSPRQGCTKQEKEKKKPTGVAKTKTGCDGVLAQLIHISAKKKTSIVGQVNTCDRYVSVIVDDW